MKDGYSFHADYEGLDTTYEDYRKAYEAIFTRAGLDFKGIIGDGGAMGGKDSQEFMAITPDRTDLDRWLVLDKSIASIDEIPADVLEDIKKELASWLVSGEDTIAYSTESSYAANLEMASNEYKPTTKVVAQEDVKRVETPDCKSIDDVAAFLKVDEEQTIKTLFFVADNEPVVALLVGNDQVNDVKLKTILELISLNLQAKKKLLKSLVLTLVHLDQLTFLKMSASLLTAKCKMLPMQLLAQTKTAIT